MAGAKAQGRMTTALPIRQPVDHTTAWLVVLITQRETWNRLRAPKAGDVQRFGG
jgi:hypothetical protein